MKKTDVGILRYTGEGRGPRGNVVETWETEPSTTIPDCIIAPRSTSDASGTEPETAGYENRVIREWTLFFPVGWALHDKDRVRVGDTDWEVEGIAFDWTSPFTNWPSGQQVALKVVAG